MTDKEIALRLYELYFSSSNTMTFERFMNQFTEMVFLVKHGKSIQKMTIQDGDKVFIDFVTYKRKSNTEYIFSKNHNSLVVPSEKIS